MRVLHVESGRHLYGGALQVLLLLRGLRAEGVENVLVCPQGSAIAKAGPDAVLREIPMSGDLDVGVIPRLRRIVRETRPDIIHLHSRRGADWLGGMASLGLGLPVVLSRRVDHKESRQIAVAKYAMFNRTVSISEQIRRVLVTAGVPPEKITCVHDGVPPAAACSRDREWFGREFSIPADALVVGVVAQLIPRKGHRYLLDAIPQLMQSTADICVAFFGSGESELALRARIRRSGLEQIVFLPGFRDDMPRILPCLDLVVHPALNEGLGVALLQASQAGLAVVASRAGGIPEAVVDGETGLLVPPGNARALADAVGSLLRDPERRRRLGQTGKVHIAENFSVEKMVAGNLAVYLSC